MKPDGHLAENQFRAGEKRRSVAILVDAGLKHQQAGRLVEAEASYRQALDAEPEYPDALHLLGTVFLQAGHCSPAIELIRRAIRRSAQNVVYHFNLGLALHTSGQFDEAVAEYGQAIQLSPDLAEAHYNLGNALRALGRLDESVTAYRQAIRVRPDYAEAHSSLGAAFRDQDKLDDSVAELREAIRIKPDFAEAHSNIGAAFYDLGKLDDAVAAYRLAIRIRPDFAEAYSNLGVALFEQRKLDEAVAAYRHAILIKPDHAEAYSGLGGALRDQGRYDEAVGAYRRATQIRPDYADAHSNLGVVLHFQHKLEEAIAAHKQAIAVRPDFAEPYQNLAMLLRETGRLTESRAAMQHSVRIAPRNAKYARQLAELVRYDAGHPHLLAMEELARDKDSLPLADRIELHFALAKAYEDVGRHAEASRQLLEGNALKRGQITYDEGAALGILDRTRAIFSPDLFRAWGNAGQPSSAPVFIVGMPRSGSTLVEQILAAHPMIFGGGELDYFGEAVKGIRTKYSLSTAFPELARDMGREDFAGLGERYLAKIEALAPAAAHITDKMPANFIFVGLIHLALPNAIIIHTSRDPIDTCLSCFSRLFASEQDYAYDLAELGRYCRHYQALMAHWREVLPQGRILDVRYEDVVHDLEGQARRIIAHCGLEWDPSCLAFHKAERPVRTASATQVRQPIYATSIGRWRVHEPFLGPLLQELAAPSPR